MKFSAFSLSSEWNDLKKFEKLDLERKQVVFYAENSASFNHFKLLIEELTEKMNIQIKNRVFLQPTLHAFESDSWI